MSHSAKLVSSRFEQRGRRGRRGSFLGFHFFKGRAGQAGPEELPSAGFRGPTVISRRPKNPKIAAAQHHKKYPSLGTATLPSEPPRSQFQLSTRKIICKRTTIGSAQLAPAQLHIKVFCPKLGLACCGTLQSTYPTSGWPRLSAFARSITTNLTTGTPCLGVGLVAAAPAAGKEDKVTSCALVWRHPLMDPKTLTLKGV